MHIQKFSPLKTRFRATFAADAFANDGAPRVERIDPETETLYGVQITLEGEAKGHGVFLDAEFCQAVADAGNATGETGLKVRYGHPAMCSDAIGTELGRAKNFRVVDLKRQTDDGEVVAKGVLADITLLKSAHAAPQGDIAKHVLEVAKEDPSQFGQSIVFTYADLKSTDADGNTILASAFEDFSAFKDAAGENKIYAVLGKLHGSDFTDTPAATDGIFTTGTLAEEAEQMLDEHPEIFEVIKNSPKSVVEFLERTGLDKLLESARVAGLQAAKDKRIAELEKTIAEQSAHFVESREQLHQEWLAAAKAKDEEIENLKAEIDAKQKALDLAAGDIKQLEAKCAETEKALAETQAALKVETERYRAQIGGALQQPTQPELHGKALIRSRFTE